MSSVINPKSLMIGLLICPLLTGCFATAGLEKTSIIDRLERADTAFQAGEFEQAKTDYQAVIDESPDLVSPYFRLALISYRNGDPEQSGKHLKAVLQRDPQHTPAIYNLAVIHLEQARRFLHQHEHQAPALYADPRLIEIRRAIEALGAEPAATE